MLKVNTQYFFFILDTSEALGSGNPELLLFFYKLFVSGNGNQKRTIKGKILKCGLSESSPHVLFWKGQALPLLKSMEYEKSKPKDKTKLTSLVNWMFTIRNFIKI